MLMRFDRFGFVIIFVLFSLHFHNSTSESMINATWNNMNITFHSLGKIHSSLELEPYHRISSNSCRKFRHLSKEQGCALFSNA